MKVYNLVNRLTGEPIKKTPWTKLSTLKQFITLALNSGNWGRGYIETGNYDLIVYELVEKQSIPIIRYNDTNKMLYSMLEEEKK